MTQNLELREFSMFYMLTTDFKWLAVVFINSRSFYMYFDLTLWIFPPAINYLAESALNWDRNTSSTVMSPNSHPNRTNSTFSILLSVMWCCGTRAVPQYLSRPITWLLGAMVARSTPDRKVGRSIRSVVRIFVLLLNDTKLRIAWFFDVLHGYNL